jgi:hypothetical protein
LSGSDQEDNSDDGLNEDLDWMNEKRAPVGGHSDSEADDDNDSEDEQDEAKQLHAYMRQMDRELDSTKVMSGFERPNTKTSSAPSNSSSAAAAATAAPAATSELEPIDLNINLVKNLLDSYAAQHGEAGPVSNLLGSLGIKLPTPGAP